MPDAHSVHMVTAAILVRSLVMDQACFLQGAVNNIYSAFHITLLIGIFYS